MQPDGSSRGVRRLLVSWRDGAQPPSIHDVGCLAFSGKYTFRYLEGAYAAPGFRTLPGLPDLERVHGPAVQLFPAFSGRVMSRTRPDFPEYLAALGLTEVRSDLDILARSAGQSRGDRLVLTEEPFIGEGGVTSSIFLVRGLRFALPDQREREAALAALENETYLFVRDDVKNEVNRQALLICTETGIVLGWVPDALVHYMRLVTFAGGSLTVHRINGALHS